MFNEEYFRNKITSFYHDMDKAFRINGCEALGSQDIYFRLSRMAPPYLEYSEIKRICADVDGPALDPDEPSGHRRWPFAWGRASLRYKKIAENAEKAGHIVTAGMNYLRASLLAHSGQMLCRPEWPEKLQLQKERAGCYRKAAQHLGLERHEIPIGEHRLPAYLWLPKSIQQPPVVILAPGANSVKEELHRWAEAFVARGLATVTFDGPGQGELTPLQGSTLPLRLENYHQAFTAIINYLETMNSNRVDVKKIAIWGQSMGGHLVIRAFNHEHRPVAVVNLAGPPTEDGFPYANADHTEEMRDLLGFKSIEETWNYLQKYGNGYGAVDQIKVPCLIIYGSRDDLMGEDVMKDLAAKIGSNAELMLFKDGNHGVFNWDNIMTDAMADWLVDKLS